LNGQGHNGEEDEFKIDKIKQTFGDPKKIDEKALID